jgi:hypothetical protein
MAVSAIVRTIGALMKGLGYRRGAQKAIKMGFKNKDIRKAAIVHGKKYGGTKAMDFETVMLHSRGGSASYQNISQKAKAARLARGKAKLKSKKLIRAGKELRGIYG